MTMNTSIFGRHRLCPPAAAPLAARHVFAGCLALLALVSALTPAPVRAVEAAARPNIVVILVDDLRADDLAYAGHPFVRTPHFDRIAGEGVDFRNAFATTPLCSPSRASILTGLYAHAHGITDNTERGPASHQLKTFPQLLQAAGYETAFVGKWHMGNDDGARPGFDHWVALKGQGTTLDADLNVNGRRVATKGHVTDILSGHAVTFLQQPRQKPFLLFLSHKALHPETTQHADGSLSDPKASTFIPAERHKALYADEDVSLRPNAFGPPEGKPALLREIPGLPPLGPETGTSSDTILARLRMLAAVDESAGEIIKTLETAGSLDRTVIVLMSDHGYFYGEHGLSVERRLAYEESIRIPMAWRYPPLIAAGQKRNHMALTLDLAPTLLELAGVAVPPGLHGLSLVPVFKSNDAKLRDAFVIEYFSDAVFPRTRNLGYQAIRTENWKYIRYVELEGMDELYDMNRDLFEMRNHASNPRLAETLREVKEQLAAQLKRTGAAVR